jgi:hypothetical protein
MRSITNICLFCDFGGPLRDLMGLTGSKRPGTNDHFRPIPWTVGGSESESVAVPLQRSKMSSVTPKNAAL